VRWLTAAAAWQSWAVVGRHARVHLRSWHINFLPPAGEPVLMLLAFGLGLGGYVASVEWRGREVPYMTFVAPGILAYACFMTAIFQSLYAAFIRMRYQRTWEGQLTTQIELRHVVWGEVLWAALLSTTYVAIVSVVLAGCHLLGLVSLDFRALIVLAPVVFVAGCAFASLGLFFTAVVPTIDHMNLPVFLLVLPLAVVSGTYFPLADPRLAPLRALSPLYHLAEAARGLLLGAPAAGHLVALLAMATVMILVLVPLDLRLLRRRVLGE
jgi:lipooligosaccharide transport system permease protein